MYCMYCGAEMNNPNQTVCENCGKEIPANIIDKKTNKEPILNGDSNKEYIVRKTRRWRCC